METRLTIWGSCVSRDIVRLTGDRFSLTQYVALQNLGSAFSRKAPPPEDFGIPSKFKIRSLKGDFDSNAMSQIATAAEGTDVVLLDLGSERHGIFEVAEGAFVSATPTHKHVLAALNIKRRLIPFGSDEHRALFQQAAINLKDGFDALGLLEKTRIVKFGFTDQIAEGGMLDLPISAAALNEAHTPYYEILDAAGIQSLPPLPEDLRVTTTAHQWGPTQNHFVDSAYEWWADQIDRVAAEVSTAR